MDGCEEATELRAVRVGEVEKHRVLLVSLEAVHRRRNAGGTDSQAVLQESLDEFRLCPVGRHSTDSFIDAVRVRQVAKLCEVENYVPHEQRMEQVVP